MAEVHAATVYGDVGSKMHSAQITGGLYCPIFESLLLQHRYTTAITAVRYRGHVSYIPASRPEAVE
eukprot:736990-Pyramimonas_sp.AAC.1